MKIKFLGAAGTVTGSSYVLTSGSGRSILVDLGMFQGLPAIDEKNYEAFDYDCSSLVGAILTHAHLDHCGRLPILLPLGFTGDIWMTPATRDLTELSRFTKKFEIISKRWRRLTPPSRRIIRKARPSASLIFSARDFSLASLE